MSLLDLLYNKILIGSLAGNIILFLLIIYFITHPKKIHEWALIFFKATAWMGIKFEKKYIAKDIEEKTNKFKTRINNSVSGLIQGDLEINWVEEDTRESFFRDGKVIVRMNSRHNQAENFAYTILAYTRRAAIPNAKPYVKRQVVAAIDFTLAKNIISESKEHGAMEELFSSYMEPQIKEQPEIKEHMVTFDQLSVQGLFTRIYLRELMLFGQRIYPMTPTDSFLKESSDFTEFIKKIAERKRKEKIPNKFKSRNISTALIYVATPEKLSTQGLIPYKTYIETVLKGRYRNFYIVGLGLNVLTVMELTNYLKNHKMVADIETETYHRKKLHSEQHIQVICTTVFTKNQ